MVSSVHPATINRAENVFGQAPVRQVPVKHRRGLPLGRNRNLCRIQSR